MTANLNRKRTIRSYVKRAGRMTTAQQNALDTLWPKFGIDFEDRFLDLETIFVRDAPLILEIGFGNGETLALQAAEHLEKNYLGVEVHEPGVGHLLMLTDKGRLENIRVICHDAVEVLSEQIPDSSLSGVNLYFPDPWPKKRHHKRRLVQIEFIDLISRKVLPWGAVQLATDWKSYANHMLEVMEASPYFDNAMHAGGYSPRPQERPTTKFEKRGERLGHQVWDLIYIRNSKGSEATKRRPGTPG